jgi:acyl-coenzyme A synthetase/AMP-(fatty) acid ligase
LADGCAPSIDFAQSIRESLRGQIAPYKVPHSIEFAESLPKSAIGKILRAGLVRPT